MPKKTDPIGSGSKTLTKIVKKVFIETLWHKKAFKMAAFLTKLVQGGGFTSKISISGSNFFGADLKANKNIKKEFVLLQRLLQRFS